MTAPFAKWCADIAAYQKNHDRYFILAHPQDSALWATSPIRWLGKRGSSNWTTLEPAGAQWPTGALHNLPSGIFKPLNPPVTYSADTVSRKRTRCQEIQPVEVTRPGAITTRSCSIIADCLTTIVDRELTETHQTSFVSSLFDILHVSVEAGKELAEHVKELSLIHI